MKAYAYIEGTSCGATGPAGIGVVIRDPCGKNLASIGSYIGVTGDHVALLRALIMALRESQRLGLRKIKIYTSSRWLVEQILNQYAYNDPMIARLVGVAKRLMGRLNLPELVCIPVENNQEACRLAQSVRDRSKVVQFPVERYVECRLSVVSG
jgi:ribonuclease HI